MALPQSAVDHYQREQQISVSAAKQAQTLWKRMEGGELDASWSRIADDVLTTTVAAQSASVASAGLYVPRVLAEQGIDAPAIAELRPQRFVNLAFDGRPLDTLLNGAVYETKARIKTGAGVQEALAAGGAWLQSAVLESVRGANRQAVAAGYTTRPAVTGWVRMLNPPSCKFCVVLAGKFFRWNEGFQSHDNCDCRHIPSLESVAGDLTVDPYSYFASLTPKEQDRLFGKADAQALRDGADIYRVVNVRARGLSTSRQAIKYGTPSRLTIDEIYATTKTRDEAIDMMTAEGFITGPQTAGGNLLGNESTDARIIAAGRGRGAYRVGADTVTTKRAARYDAVVSGEREPLNRSTMTAGERRIYDDYFRAEQALLARSARTIGGNSADRGTIFDSITTDQADALAMTFIRRIDRVRRNGTAQDKRMAERLWARYNALV